MSDLKCFALMSCYLSAILVVCRGYFCFSLSSNEPFQVYYHVKRGSTEKAGKARMEKRQQKSKENEKRKRQEKPRGPFPDPKENILSGIRATE